MIREVVRIDEDLCDGCGDCVPSCHEGAIRIVNGKARLVSDRLCDGLGACLGHCPRGAISIEKREAEAFDEKAVAAVVAGTAGPAAKPQRLVHAGGACPSTRFVAHDPPAAKRSPADDAPADPARSELTHWPVQLALLAPTAPVLRDADLLLAADCVPVAMPSFHATLLRGRPVVIGCPKFDDLPAYVERLASMIRAGGLASITVARMEVPCCRGILGAAVEGRRVAASSIPIVEVVVGTRGEVLSQREIPPAC